MGTGEGPLLVPAAGEFRIEINELKIFSEEKYAVGTRYFLLYSQWAFSSIKTRVFFC